MSDIPAFPEIYDVRCDSDRRFEAESGMSLLDYFAGHALIAVAKHDLSQPAADLPKCAERAYAYANAMMAQREKEQGDD